MNLGSLSMGSRRIYKGENCNVKGGEEAQEGED